jgi:molybdopterin synthase sulfur carrier subunit
MAGRVGEGGATVVRAGRHGDVDRDSRLSRPVAPRYADPAVHVHVRLGSGLATAAGTRRMQVELPGEATVDALLIRVGELEPGIAGALDSALPVVRGTHASRAQALADGDEVALLIPVAGGAGTEPERSLQWP